MADKFIFRDNYEFDWEDVEYKVKIISRRFQNIDPKYREDLEQELRLFAYTTSSHYNHMYRKAIDYWRHLTATVYPEVCIFDVEDEEGNRLAVPEESYDDKYVDSEVTDLLGRIHQELEVYAETKRETEYVTIAERIMDILAKDIFDIPDESLKVIKTTKYRRGRLSVSWICDQTGYDYKKIQNAMNILSEIVRTLYDMGKIDQDYCKYFE